MVGGLIQQQHVGLGHHPHGQDESHAEPPRQLRDLGGLQMIREPHIIQPVGDILVGQARDLTLTELHGRELLDLLQDLVLHVHALEVRRHARQPSSAHLVHEGSLPGAVTAHHTVAMILEQLQRGVAQQQLASSVAQEEGLDAAEGGFALAPLGFRATQLHDILDSQSKLLPLLVIQEPHQPVVQRLLHGGQALAGVRHGGAEDAQVLLDFWGHALHVGHGLGHLGVQDLVSLRHALQISLVNCGVVGRQGLLEVGNRSSIPLCRAIALVRLRVPARVLLQVRQSSGGQGLLRRGALGELPDLPGHVTHNGRKGVLDGLHGHGPEPVDCTSHVVRGVRPANVHRSQQAAPLVHGQRALALQQILPPSQDLLHRPLNQAHCVHSALLILVGHPRLKPAHQHLGGPVRKPPHDGLPRPSSRGAPILVALGRPGQHRGQDQGDEGAEIVLEEIGASVQHFEGARAKQGTRICSPAGGNSS
mmetsp:Transcript_37330/g.89778  ORF Transcript_37330/g.89778 Transcript_37330/m.89778 type:complete len:477 (-) Transcript_37330:1622-3052(-)